MKHKFIYLLPVLVLASCGTKVNKLGTYGMDHSANWNDNYYTYYDEHLLKLETSIITLDSEANKVFTSYSDDNFVSLEEKATGEGALIYADDFHEDTGYGPYMRLSKSNDYIKEGVTSKLFNGQMFCHGYYEAARVQIKESGISIPMGKKLVSSDYLYLQFKSALDFKTQTVDGHDDDITINITFYNNEKGVTYSYPLKEVATNKGETYIFYGFSTKDLDLNNATDIAISYHIDKETYNEEKGTSIAHALLLYEFGFKNPSFR
ncbi:MAG: hypothetical protein K5906_01560 [Bacilli bacterium]|nr:hypothetical protein [Bacilli bacterium]